MTTWILEHVTSHSHFTSTFPSKCIHLNPVPPVLPVLPVPHHERSAPQDPSEALVVGSGEQRQVSWSAVAQSRPPTLPDPLETRDTPHTCVRRGKHHLQGETTCDHLSTDLSLCFTLPPEMWGGKQHGAAVTQCVLETVGKSFSLKQSVTV